MNVIHQCALAVITDRGRHVVPPSTSRLAQDEEDFLQRHVSWLRRATKPEQPHGRFRPGSSLKADLDAALTADDALFTTIAGQLVDALVTAMQAVPNAQDCVVALLTEGTDAPTTVTLLKLDAEVEAARLEQTGGRVRLRVFQDLLPRPGEIQKGFSWPDPRHPDSEVIIVDKVVSGTARYFQNAFAVDASPKATDTERALVQALTTELPPAQAVRAAALVEAGGRADQVVATIRRSHPDFRGDLPELGADGKPPGHVRGAALKVTKTKFSADGIDLQVPLDKLVDVHTVEVDGHYETRITTSTPLTPLRPRQG